MGPNCYCNCNCYWLIAKSLHVFSPPFAKVMVFAFVRLRASATSHASRIHALLLPDADDASKWMELSVRPSKIHGLGVFPAHTTALDWCDTQSIPVLLPCIGLESVVSDAHSLKCCIAVLKGDFEEIRLQNVLELGGAQQWVADGIFAIPNHASQRKASVALPPETRLLQVMTSNSYGTCY